MNQVNLYDAHKQWANRPKDERFSSLEELYAFCKNKKTVSRERVVNWDDVVIDVTGEEDIVVKGPSKNPFKFNNWSFNQVCSFTNSPGSYLSRLPAGYSADLLNWGLKERLKEYRMDRGAKLLLDVEHGFVRSINTEIYGRIWDVDVVELALRLKEKGWTTPPARESNGSKNAGLYAGDRDCFIFMVDEGMRVKDGTDDGLAVGVFLENSEVGSGYFDGTLFLYRYVCGNHIVWDVSGVKKVRVKHIGEDVEVRAMEVFKNVLRQYNKVNVKEIEEGIRYLKNRKVEENEEDYAERLFYRKLLGKKEAKIVMEMAKVNESEDGDPLSVWSIAQQITRLSQREVFVENRKKLEIAASKVMGW